MTVSDSFFRFRTQLDSPVTRAATVTPSDTLLTNFVSRAILLGADGVIRVTFMDDDEPITLPPLLGGVLYPFRIKQVHETDTTVGLEIAIFQ